MRSKTEERREAILRIARDAFCANGFDATSMSQIAEQLGGSKSTLYNYFSSKEEILFAVLVDGAETFASMVRNLLKEVDDFRTQLIRFVESLITELHKPQTIQILRVAISVGGNSEIGRRFLEHGPNDAWQQVAAVLTEEIKKGHLRDEDPALMTAHLRCLCEMDVTHNLLGARITKSKTEIALRAEQTVDIFLRAYGA